MRKEEVLKHFGSASELARILGISPASISEWGKLIPKGRAYQIQVITAGALRVDPSAYENEEHDAIPPS